MFWVNLGTVLERRMNWGSGRDKVRAILVWVLSADCDLGRGIWYGRRCLEKSSWVKVYVGGETVHLLEVVKVVKLVWGGGGGRNGVGG